MFAAAFAKSMATEQQTERYLLGYVSFFAGQLSLPLCVCDALGELLL